MTAEDEARAAAEVCWPSDMDGYRELADRTMRATQRHAFQLGYIAASRREPSGATTRKAIADAVRRHCTLTPNPMSGPYPLDATVQAVADWIENPPEWVRFPSESTAVGASAGTSKSNANDLNREPSANVSNRPETDISSGGMSAEQSDTNPIDGAQAWMASDLGTALGHPDVTEENDGYLSWAEWWAHLIHQVKELRLEATRTEGDAHREAFNRAHWTRSDSIQLGKLAMQAGIASIVEAEQALMVGARMRAHGFTPLELDKMIIDFYRAKAADEARRE